jgi:hypothetical protein
LSNKDARSKADVLHGTLDLMVLQTLDTPAGRRQLARERHAWDRMAGIIHAVLRGEA